VSMGTLVRITQKPFRSASPWILVSLSVYEKRVLVIPVPKYLPTSKWLTTLPTRRAVFSCSLRGHLERVVVSTILLSCFSVERIRSWRLRALSLAVVNELRGIHPDHVFTHKWKPLSRINDRGWKQALIRAGLPQVRVPDLKHTFDRRLRAAGVSFEDRQDLLGHKFGRIATHYSQAELSQLVSAANNVCGDESRKSPALVILRNTNRKAIA
jgi:hypothetical protein